MKTISTTSYLALGGILLLSSGCRDEATVKIAIESDRKIVFHTSLPEHTTKAEEIAQSPDYFHLTVYNESDPDLVVRNKLTQYNNLFDTKITKDSNSGSFSSDQCVWPPVGKGNHILHFFAYYPSLQGEALPVNSTLVNGKKKTLGHKIEKFSVNTDIAKQVDFVTTYATGSMQDNLFSGIALNFRHQLSRIEVKAKGSNRSCDIEIAGLRIGGVSMNGDFEFQTSDADGNWTNISNGICEYIFGVGETIVKVGSVEQSIFGKKLDDSNDNCAMLIPSTDTEGWQYASDIHNDNERMYISVLLRVLDKTPSGGLKQQYPYYDKSQGLNAPNIPIVYLAVDNKGIVKANPGQLYKGDNGKYYTNAAKTTEYKAPTGSKVTEFGWAAMPVTRNWSAGYIYTYTLDYAYGVGLHDPAAPGTDTPKV